MGSSSHKRVVIDWYHVRRNEVIGTALLCTVGPPYESNLHYKSSRTLGSLLEGTKYQIWYQFHPLPGQLLSVSITLAPRAMHILGSSPPAR